MKIQNAFSTLLTVLITAVVVGVLTGVISYSSAASKKDLEIEDLKEQLSQAKEEASVEPGSMILDTSETNNQQPTTDSQQATTTPSTAADETANWKTYTNDKYGFTFKYPGEWQLNKEEKENSLNFTIYYPAEESIAKGNYITIVVANATAHGMEIYHKVSTKTMKVDDKNWEVVYWEGDKNSDVVKGDFSDNLAITTGYYAKEKNRDYVMEAYYTKSTEGKLVEKIFNQILSTFQFTK